MIPPLEGIDQFGDGKPRASGDDPWRWHTNVRVSP